MREKRNKKRALTIAYTGIALFVIITVVELAVVHIRNYTEQNDKHYINKYTNNVLAYGDSMKFSVKLDNAQDIIGRELTEEEIAEMQKLCQMQMDIRTSNDGIYQGIKFSDGTWRTEGDALFLYMVGPGAGLYAFVENAEDIISRYREYTENSIHFYTEGTILRWDTCARWYSLEFESFYLDGITAIPEKVNIYEIRENLDENLKQQKSAEVKTLVETIEYNVQNKEGLRHFSGGGLHYYAEECPNDIWVDAIVMTEEMKSVEEREEILENYINKTDFLRERDLLGHRKYKILYGNNVYMDYYDDTISYVSCEENPEYRQYMDIQYRDEWMIGIAINLVIAYGIAAVIINWMLKRKKDTAC